MKDMKDKSLYKLQQIVKNFIRNNLLEFFYQTIN